MHIQANFQSLPVKLCREGQYMIKIKSKTGYPPKYKDAKKTRRYLTIFSPCRLNNMKK